MTTGKSSFSKDCAFAIRFVGFSLLVLLVASCASSQHKVSYLQGYVSENQDVSGAQLKVTDLKGNTISEQTASSSDFGAFMIPVQKQSVQTGFRVVADGGTDSGQAVTSSLEAQFGGVNPDRDIIYLNLVTTMVCRYLDRVPDATLADATAVVKTFLGIPAFVDIGSGLYHDPTYFSPQTFLTAAAANGGVDAYMGALVDEMIQGSPATQTFPPPQVLSATPAGELVATSAGETMAGSIGKGILSWGAGFALNQGLKAVFPSLGAPTEADIQQMEAMLEAIQTQITQLSNQVAAAQDEIDAAIKKSTYEIANMNLIAYATMVKNDYARLQASIDSMPTNTDSVTGAVTPNTDDPAYTQCQNTINDVNKSIGQDIVPYLGSLHNMLYGSTGFYKIYADYLHSQKKFLSQEDYQNKVVNVFNYYNQIEATAVLLADEYYRSTNQLPSLVTAVDTRLATDSQAERAWVNTVTRIPDGTYIYQGDNLNLMIYLPSDFYSPMQYGPYVWNTGGGDCDVNNSYTGGLTAVIDAEVCSVALMDWDKKLGFDNWRFPELDWLNTMFNGWQGEAASPGEYAKNQGLTPMDNNRYLPTWEDPATCGGIWCESKWEFQNMFDDHYGFIYYRTTSGSAGWLQWQATNQLNGMPVREISSTEHYLW